MLINLNQGGGVMERRAEDSSEPVGETTAATGTVSSTTQNQQPNNRQAQLSLAQ